jgi:hypothetical protein
MVLHILSYQHREKKTLPNEDKTVESASEVCLSVLVRQYVENHFNP